MNEDAVPFGYFEHEHQPPVQDTWTCAWCLEPVPDDPQATVVVNFFARDEANNVLLPLGTFFKLHAWHIESIRTTDLKALARVCIQQRAARTRVPIPQAFKIAFDNTPEEAKTHDQPGG